LTFSQILDRSLVNSWIFELFAIVGLRPVEDIEQGACAGFFLAAMGLGAGDFQASCFRQRAYRIHKVHALVVSEEGNGVTARATAEAMVKLLVGADGERGGFFFMERAAGGIVFTAALKWHPRMN